jgi:C-terminal processing protease CtpA/Prc
MLAADVIVRYGDRNIYDGDDLIKAVRRSEPEEKVAIEVDRAGTKKTFTVTLDIKEEFTPPPVVVAPGHPFEFDFQRPSQLQGLSLQKLGKQLAEYFETPGKRGVLVTSVKKNSPADSAGFRAGDVITTVNGVAVRDPGDFSEELREAGLSQVPVEVVRKGKVTKLSLKPEKSRKYHDKDGDGDPDWSLFRQRSLPETWFEDFHGADGHDAIERLKNHLSELSDEIRSEVGRLKDSIAREIRNL